MSPFSQLFFECFGSLSSFRSKLCFLLLLRNDSCVVDSSYSWFSDSSADSVDSVADSPSADDLLEFFFTFFYNLIEFSSLFFFLNFAFFEHLAGMLM